MELNVQVVRGPDGDYRVINGQRRLQVALQLHGEVVVRSDDGTLLLLMLTPGGDIVATRDQQVVRLFV